MMDAEPAQSALPSAAESGRPLSTRAKVLDVIADRARSVATQIRFGDVVAGLSTSVLLIANIVSFAALMFPGELRVGIPVAVWAMLVGSALGGLWIARATSIPPIATGMDSPTGTVLVLLSASVGSTALAAGSSPQLAAQTVMLVFSLATLLSGITLYLLGALRWATYLRFVPSSVVGGFLAATGVLLLAGGIRMATGRPLMLSTLIPFGDAAGVTRLLVSLAVAGLLLGLRNWVKASAAIPIALIAMTLVGGIALWRLGLSSAQAGWYLPALGALQFWSPFAITRTAHLSLQSIGALVPEMLAVTAVTIVSLVTKFSGLEAARATTGDLDGEFRANGIANMAVVPLGGIANATQSGSSRMLEQTGAETRLSGIVAALVLGIVALSSFNITSFVPIPVIAGLILLLGYDFLRDALLRPIQRGAWFDVIFILAIMGVCVRFGYLAGVVAGIICACLLFAASYARIGVVRQRLSRANFTGNIDRAERAAEHLQKAGEAIQIYRLSGYIFFGSCEALFERIRRDLDQALPRLLPGDATADIAPRFILLDFSEVTGLDGSAILSLVKLRNAFARRDIVVVFCGLVPADHALLVREGFFNSTSRHRSFGTLNAGLAWAEDQMLAAAGLAAEITPESFLPWLQSQFGADIDARALAGYLVRRDIAGSEVLHRQGDASDTIDLVAAGRLSIDYAMPGGELRQLRRILAHTVVGEMGFLRRTVRAAMVSSDGPATLYTMTRPGYERMRRERPDLATAFDAFLLRILANRVENANREIAALRN